MQADVSLKSTAQRWLAPPIFPQDDERTQRARLLNVAHLVSLVLTALALLAIVIGKNVPIRTLVIVSVWLGVLIQSVRWLHAGKLGRAELMLIAGFFITLTTASMSLGTIRAPATAVYVFWVMLAVTIYRLPGLLFASLVSSLTVLGLISAENLGMLPKPDVSVGATQWLMLTGLFATTAALAYYTSQVTAEALRLSRNENEQRIRAESELRKLTRAVEQSPNSIVITDLRGTIEYANPRFYSVTGFNKEDVIGENPRILKSNLTPKETYRDLWRTLSSGHEWSGEFVNRKKDGSLFWESAIISPVTDSGGVLTHYLSIKQDITERKRAEEALRLSEERHRLIANFASDVIWTMGLDGVLTYISPSIEALRGVTPDEAMMETHEAKLTPASYAMSQEYFEQLHADLQAGRPPKAFRSEMEYRCKDGSTVWTEVMVQPVLGKDGKVVELLGVTRSIAEHKRLMHELKSAKEAAEHANAELFTMATTDTLTGVWNRRHFEHTAATAIAQAARYGHPLSMLLFDIDRFKAVNDRYGHQAGDQVLIELTRVVSKDLRAADILARWGGEEFVVISAHCNEGAAMQLAEKIRKEVEAHRFPVVGSLTISLGVAEFSAGDTLDTWFGKADRALYEAKGGGRNAVRCSSLLNV